MRTTTETMPGGTKWETSRITHVELRNGSATIAMVLDKTECTTMDIWPDEVPRELSVYYTVYASRSQATSRGVRLEGDKHRTFTDLSRARDFANGWVTGLTGKGWVVAKVEKA